MVRQSTPDIECSSRGWVCIDPKGIIGERAYDFANVFFNPDDKPEMVENEARIDKYAEIASEKLKIEKLRILQYAFAFGCLSSSWSIEEGKIPERRMRITRLIENHPLLK